ncbi:MAG: efflux RND transporter periplasmic adaptor subunit [Micavibrio sp.]|nr:efflux RND transporter periplasmic adaptor subunit [Micavibrio sp.]
MLENLKPNAGGKKRIFKIIVAIIAAAFLFSFVKSRVGCMGIFPMLKNDKKNTAKKAPEELPSPVKVYKVARVSFRDTLPALGSIKGFREFDLKFPTQGTVEYVNFKEGEKITQGDIIASLDQKEALLKLEYSKIEQEKTQKLYELGSVIEQKLKQSQLEYQSAKTELDKTNLIAPSDGYVGALEVDKGSFVTPQDKIGTFVDIKDIYAEFGIIEKDIAKVKEGQNTEVVLDSFPDQVFKGQLDSVSPIVEGRSRTIKVRSKMSNPDERVKPGMFGRVNVLVYEKEQAIVIPSSSFKKKDNQYFVYLIHPEGGAETGLGMPSDPSLFGEEPPAPEPAAPKAKKDKKGSLIPEEPKGNFGTLEIRNIEVAYATPDAIEIKEGLEEGDLVAVDVEQDLQDRARVEITETQEGIF